MKLILKIPGGGKLYFESQPMSRERFEALCCVMYALIAAVAIVCVVALIAK